MGHKQEIILISPKYEENEDNMKINIINDRDNRKLILYINSKNYKPNRLSLIRQIYYDNPNLLLNLNLSLSLLNDLNKLKKINIHKLLHFVLIRTLIYHDDIKYLENQSLIDERINFLDNNCLKSLSKQNNMNFHVIIFTDDRHKRDNKDKFQKLAEKYKNIGLSLFIIYQKYGIRFSNLRILENRFAKFTGGLNNLIDGKIKDTKNGFSSIKNYDVLCTTRIDDDDGFSTNTIKIIQDSINYLVNDGNKLGLINCVNGLLYFNNSKEIHKYYHSTFGNGQTYFFQCKDFKKTYPHTIFNFNHHQAHEILASRLNISKNVCSRLIFNLYSNKPLWYWNRHGKNTSDFNIDYKLKKKYIILRDGLDIFISNIKEPVLLRHDEDMFFNSSKKAFVLPYSSEDVNFNVHFGY